MDTIVQEGGRREIYSILMRTVGGASIRKPGPETGN